MQLSNYHSHCTFCDGRSAPEDFVRFAIAKGFSSYGFSSHSPLPFETFWNMSRENMSDYLSEIDRLRNKYAGSITLYAGLEIDYLDETYNASIPYFRELPLDYRIGSIHYLPIASPLKESNMVCIDGPFSDFKASVSKQYEGNIARLVTAYFEATLRMIEAGGIDIVGHIDKIYMNGCLLAGFSFDSDWFQEPFRACLEAVRRKGMMVEVNTKNLKRRQELYPSRKHLALLREMKIPVMVNSDCHAPDLINEGRAEAFDMLIDAGFGSTVELVDGKWEEIPLS